MPNYELERRGIIPGIGALGSTILLGLEKLNIFRGKIRSDMECCLQ